MNESVFFVISDIYIGRGTFGFLCSTEKNKGHEGNKFLWAADSGKVSKLSVTQDTSHKRTVVYVLKPQNLPLNTYNSKNCLLLQN